MLGKCLKFDRAKGFGFILSEDPTLPDVFCHFSVIEPNNIWTRKFLIPGMQVSFEYEQDPADATGERLRATTVQVSIPITIARQISDADKAGQL